MNLDRAREFYSAYYEGGLDDGLRQAFQRALTKDQKISDEYSQFVRIMGELKHLKTDVDLPADLHEKISTRLDAVERNNHANRNVDLFFAWKPLSYGVAASIAIIATIISVSSNNNSATSTAGFVFTVEQPPTISFNEGQTLLQFSSSEKNSVSITRLADSKILAQFPLENQLIQSPLRNISKYAEVIRVSFGQKYDSLLIAIPGTSRNMGKTGTGDLSQFVKAVSDRYGISVVIASNESSASVDWILDGVDPLLTTADELAEFGLKAESRADGLLWITPN